LGNSLCFDKNNLLKVQLRSFYSASFSGMLKKGIYGFSFINCILFSDYVIKSRMKAQQIILLDFSAETLETNLWHSRRTFSSAWLIRRLISALQVCKGAVS